jgi:hypothetical protein
MESYQYNFQGRRSQTCSSSIRSRGPRYTITISSQFVPNMQKFWIGILTALTQPSPGALRTAIRETRKLTSKPFGVNITILPSINPPDYEGYARAAVEEGVRIFETAGHNRTFLLRGYNRYQNVVSQLVRCLNISRTIIVLYCINALLYDMRKWVSQSICLGSLNYTILECRSIWS